MCESVREKEVCKHKHILSSPPHLCLRRLVQATFLYAPSHGYKITHTHTHTHTRTHTRTHSQQVSCQLPFLSVLSREHRSDISGGWLCLSLPLPPSLSFSLSLSLSQVCVLTGSCG